MKHALLVAGFLLGFLWLTHGRISGDPYSYDEADYLSAASQGFWANYTDAPSLSLAEFARLGLGRGNSQGKRLELSETIRNRGDINFYRHWHGPMYYYWLMLLGPWQFHEGIVRTASLVFPILTFLLIYCGSLWLLPGAGGQLAGVIGAGLFLWGNAAARVTELAPHQMYVLWTLSSLLLAAKWMESGKRGYWYGAAGLAALAFATLEVAVVLLAALAILALAVRFRPAPGSDGPMVDWALARNSLAVFGGTVLAIWPAAVAKLSFLKAYAFMAYLALFRKAAWGNVTVLDTWRIRLVSAPVEWLLVAVAAVVWWRWRASPARRCGAPWLLYGSLMTLALARVAASTPRYTLPFLPALEVFAGLTLGSLLARWRPVWREGLAATVCLLLLAGTGRYLKEHPSTPDPWQAEVLSAIRERGLSEKRLLVPHEAVPVLHYYFPRARLQGYMEGGEPAEGAKIDGADAVLRTGLPVRIDLVR